MTADAKTAIHEDFALFVGDRLPTDGTDWRTVDKTLAAFLDGGEVREEWGVRGHVAERDPEAVDFDDWRGTREAAEKVIEARIDADWWIRSSLIRRFVIVTAPVEVTE